MSLDWRGHASRRSQKTRIHACMRVSYALRSLIVSQGRCLHLIRSFYSMQEIAYAIAIACAEATLLMNDTQEQSKEYEVPGRHSRWVPEQFKDRKVTEIYF